MGKLLIIRFTQSSIINTSSPQFCIVGSVSLYLKHFAPFPPFLPRTFHLTCASVSFLYWNTFSCMHAHTINQAPPAQQTHFTILCTDMHIYVCIYMCMFLYTQTYNRQGNRMMEIPWKTHTSIQMCFKTYLLSSQDLSVLTFVSMIEYVLLNHISDWCYSISGRRW